MSSKTEAHFTKSKSISFAEEHYPCILVTIVDSLKVQTVPEVTPQKIEDHLIKSGGG